MQKTAVKLDMLRSCEALVKNELGIEKQLKESEEAPKTKSTEIKQFPRSTAVDDDIRSNRVPIGFVNLELVKH